HRHIKKSQRFVHARQLKQEAVRQMKKAHSRYTVSEICHALEVPLSSFYYQRSDKQSDARLRHQIRVIASESNHTYGKRRIREELKEQGTYVSLYRVAKLMNKLNIYVRYPKRKHYYPDFGDEKRYAPNLLNRHFNPETYNTHWVTDVTYIRSHQGWSYLACVMDLATKEVVGYALSRSPDTKLTLAALNQAIINKKPMTGELMVHSDQGCHFSSHAFRNRLSALNIKQSMSRRGNCWDNSVMERFFRTLKSEHLNVLNFINHQSVISAVQSYLNFYNYKRKHSGLNYMTPHEHYAKMKKAA
ncbi:IS3 family transposase, partial [Vibrio palustris]|uniref:IS3 family transposase n=1 Tax=Vibrio palustris TaxID=1918946 RepID=UPI0009F8CDAC